MTVLPKIQMCRAYKDGFELNNFILMPHDPTECYLGQNNLYRAIFVQNTAIPGKKALMSNRDKQTQEVVHTDTLITTAHHHTHR